MKTLTENERKNVKKAVEYLEMAFAWKETKQGFDYWDKIRNELFELGEETKRPTCGK